MTSLKKKMVRKMQISVVIPIGIGLIIWVVSFLLGNWALASLITGAFLLIYLAAISVYDMLQYDEDDRVLEPWVLLSAGILSIIIALFAIIGGIQNVLETKIDFNNLKSLSVYHVDSMDVGKVDKENVEEATDIYVKNADKVVVETAGKADYIGPAVLEKISESDTTKITTEASEEVEDEEYVEELYEPVTTTAVTERTTTKTSKATTAVTTTRKTTTTKSYTSPVIVTPSSEDTTQIVQSHTHSYSWKYNSSMHWEECSCGEVKSKASHSFKVKKKVDASCVNDGYILYECDCGYSYKETVKATGNHSYDNGKVTKEATCSQDGVTTYTCKVCGITKTEPIKATGIHSYSSWIKNEEKHFKECSSCHEKIDEAYHSYDSGTITVAATDHSTGTKVYKCRVCGYEKEETIPMLEKTKEKIEISFGEGSYNMGSLVYVTLRYTGTSLNNLKMYLAGTEVKPELVRQGSGAAVYCFEVEVGSSGVFNLVVEADGYETAYGILTIE